MRLCLKYVLTFAGKYSKINLRNKDNKRKVKYMNSFKSFVDHMLKITETYELNELSKDGAISQCCVLTKHILWALENQNDQIIVNSTLSDMQEMVRQIENEINDITGKAEKNLQKVNISLGGAFHSGLLWFEKQYKFSPKSKEAIKLMEKAYSQNFTLEDLGLEINIVNKRKISLKFNLEKLLQEYR